MLLSDSMSAYDRFLPRLVEMLIYFEGHDWTSAEATISAIAKYGKTAAFAVPTIENATIQWLAEYGEEDCFVRECRSAIIAIDGQI